LKTAIHIEKSAVKHENLSQPTPEILAAYVDGELEACQRRDVEAWLTEHADAQSDVAAQRRIAALSQSSRPAEPDAATWSVALASIAARLPSGPRVQRHRHLPLRWLVGVAAAAAVAASIALWINRPTTVEPDFSGPPPSDPWPVVSAEDVVITSIAEADRDSVVVGELPISSPLALVNHGDINQVELTPDQGMNPQYHPDHAPMIISEPRKDAGPEGKAP
jgi:hypothetical protein